MRLGLVLCVSLACASACGASRARPSERAPAVVTVAHPTASFSAPEGDAAAEPRPDAATLDDAARLPLAAYLNAIHNRIHPLFADQFLASLDSLPTTHALSDMALFTTLELVISGKDGRLVRYAVVRASGVSAFDVGALSAVQQASPFEPAPDSIRSPDGNVYVQWEFHRDPMMSCSTVNARPFISKTP